MDNINVVIRVRPLLASEKTTILWEVRNNEICAVEDVRRSNNVPYIFNKIFGIDKTTQSLYDQVGRPTLEAVMQGYNGTILAYGPTCSGKTFTMMGSLSNPGLIPLMVQSIFQFIENTPERAFILSVSYTEIYCEAVYDLLSSERKPLNIREDASGQTFVENLKQTVVSSVADILRLMKLGEKNRTFGATSMNPNSSRSHAIFRIIIESGRLSEQGSDSGVLSTGDLATDDIMVSQLNLVDLAGSERTGMMNVVGGKFRESSKINTSLFALRKVMSQLSEDEGSFVNFRDSKLTRILQPSLGGNAKTTIICTVNPSVLEETHSTLKFASMAKRIKNAPVKNVVVSADTLLKQYANEIKDLQLQLQNKEKVNLDQEKMKQQLEETSLKNKELEDRLIVMKESVITSSALTRVGQRLRRETWGGSLGFGMPMFDCPLETPFKQSQKDFEIFRSTNSIRVLPPRFVDENPVLGNLLRDVKEFSCQVNFISEAERKLNTRYRVLKAQSVFESETHITKERDLEEQMEFVKQEQAVIANENHELKREVCELKQKIEELQVQLIPLKNPVLASLKQEMNDSSLNGSLGIISEDERAKGFILPWNENELMDKLSNLEQEAAKYLERATFAENAILKLEESNAKYRIKMEKTMDAVTADNNDMKQSLLKLKSELESVFIEKHDQKRKCKAELANAELKIFEGDRRCRELENENEKLEQRLRQMECKEKEHLDTISQLKNEMDPIDLDIEDDFDVSSMTSNLSKLDSKEPNLNDELIRAQYEELRSEAEEHKSKAEMATLESNQLRQQVINKNNELNELKDDYDTRISELTAQKLKTEEKISLLQSRFADAEKAIDKLQQRLNVYHVKELDLTEMIDQLKARCCETKSLETISEERKIQVDKLSAELKDLEGITEQNRQLKLEISKCEENMNEMIQVNEKLSQQLKDTKENLQCEEIQSLLEKLASERKTVDTLNEKLVIVTQELDALNLQWNSKEVELHQLVEIYDNKLNVLSDDKLKLSNDYTLLENLYNESENSVADLKQKLKECQTEELRMKQSIDTLTTNCEELKSWKNEAEETVKMLAINSDTLKAIEEENNQLKLRISELEEFSNNTTTDNDGLHKLPQNETTKCELEEKLLKDLADERRISIELKQELETAKQNADSARKMFSKRIESFSNRQIEHQEDKVTYEKRIASLIDEKDELDEQCSRLRDQIRRLQSMDSSILPVGESKTNGPVYRWNDDMSGGSGVIQYTYELLKAENEKLKKKLLEGCQRCRHVRSVISSKSKEKERLSYKKEITANEKQNLNSEISTESSASYSEKLSSEDRENKIKPRNEHLVNSVNYLEGSSLSFKSNENAKDNEKLQERKQFITTRKKSPSKRYMPRECFSTDIRSSKTVKEDKMSLQTNDVTEENGTSINLASPLRPANPRINQQLSTGFATPMYSSRTRTAFDSPWASIVKSHKANGHRGKEEDGSSNSKVSGQQQPESPLIHGLSKRKFADEFLSDKDCKVQ